MKKILGVLLIAVIGLSMFPPRSVAEHGHGGMMGAQPQQQPAMKMDSTDVFADGVQVTFMIMRNEMHKGMLEKMKMKEEPEAGTTHDIMVLIRDEKTGRELTGARVTLKVIGPDENEQVKAANYKEMMRTYDTYFNFAEKGKYQVLALFEIGGQKRAIGISYEI